MLLWNGFVELLELGIFTFSQAFGGQLGPAILVFSLVARLSIMPLTYRLAKRARAQQAAIAGLKPELARLRQKHAGQPLRLAEANQLLFKKHDVSPGDPKLLLGSLAQAPLFLGLFRAVGRVTSRGGSFLWIENLANPSIALALIVSALIGVGGALGAPAEQSVAGWKMLALTGMTFALVVRMSAGFGLYMAASGVVTVGQSLVLRRATHTPR